jgi:hypothetical protein
MHQKHFSAVTVQQTFGLKVVKLLLGLTWQNTINVAKNQKWNK